MEFQSRRNLITLVSRLLTLLVSTLLIFISLPAWRVNTGSLELIRWDTIILSNKTALFFFDLMAVAGIGGFIAYKYRKKGNKGMYVLTMLVTWILVLFFGFVLKNAMPFRS